MIKFITLFIICVLFFVLYNTLVPFFAIRGYYPSLLFTFCILYSIVNGSWEGIWLGVLCGLLQDIYFFHGYGLNALANMLLCAAAGYIGIGIFKEKSLIPVMSAFGLSILKGILIFIILFVSNIYTPFLNIIFNSIYTLIISILMYRWVFKLCQKDYMQKNWSFYNMK